jgi:hypothetical protein
MNAQTKQIRVTRRSPAYWRVTIDNPPINVMGPEMVREFQEIISALEVHRAVLRHLRGKQIVSPAARNLFTTRSLRSKPRFPARRLIS